MGKPALVILGGFLGSGKTTLMVEIARRLSGAGSRVGIITNDQGDMLVDTAYAAASGFVSSDVEHGCFCCNFSTFVADIDRITRDESPEFIIAEPVGSCTDLAATVLTPLSLYHRGLVDLAAFLVLVDAPRVVGEYRELNLADPITPREVLVAHQIAEAGHIVLSKNDLVTDAERAQALSYVAELNAEASITVCSAKTGEGVDGIVQTIIDRGAAAIPTPVPIDYRTYAAAEAEMGWYNGRGEIVSAFRGDKTIDAEAVAVDVSAALVTELGESLIHAKILVTTPSGSVKVSAVAGRVQADTVSEIPGPVEVAGITVNVRATLELDELSRTVHEVLERNCGTNARLVHYNHRALTPGAPVPEHRIT